MESNSFVFEPELGGVIEERGLAGWRMPTIQRMRGLKEERADSAQRVTAQTEQTSR
jgi:hypothetical protein